MKRPLLPLFLLFANLCFAQFDFGFRLGVNAADQNISNDPIGHYSALIYAPVFGVVASKALSPSIRFQSELLFTTKGQLDKVSIPYFSGYTIKDKIHYLELPISLLIDLGKNKSKGIFIPVGAYFAYGIGGKSTYKSKTSTTTETGRVIFTNGALSGSYGDYDLPLKQGDFGVNFGLGNKWKNFAVDLTYNMGLTNIHPKQFDGDKLIVKNLYLRFGVTYFLSVHSSDDSKSSDE